MVNISYSFLQHIPEVKFYNVDLFYGELKSAEGMKTQLKSFIPYIENVGILLIAIYRFQSEVCSPIPLVL